MVLFPDLFSLCTNPEETVAEVWSTDGWNIVFRRHLNDWEIGRVGELLQVLNDFNGHRQKRILSDGNSLEMEAFLLTSYILRR